MRSGKVIKIELASRTGVSSVEIRRIMVFMPHTSCLLIQCKYGNATNNSNNIAYHRPLL